MTNCKGDDFLHHACTVSASIGTTTFVRTVSDGVIEDRGKMYRIMEDLVEDLVDHIEYVKSLRKPRNA